MASVNDFQQWSQQTFGRQANPNELQQIGQKVGAPAGPGGAYSPEQYSQGQGYATEMAKAQGWQAPAQAQPNPGTPAAPGQASPLTNQLSTQVGQQMSAQPGNMQTDSTYQQQVQAFNVASQRNAERARGQLAENAAQGGQTNSGGFNTMARGLQEQQGQNESAFASQLAGQRLQQQEQKIQQAMQMALQLGDQDLARQLGAKQSELQQAGLSLQGELGRGDLSLRNKLGTGQLGLGLMGLQQNDRQHNNSLGFNYASLQNQMNRDALLALMGGF